MLTKSKCMEARNELDKIDTKLLSESMSKALDTARKALLEVEKDLDIRKLIFDEEQWMSIAVDGRIIILRKEDHDVTVTDKIAYNKLRL